MLSVRAVCSASVRAAICGVMRRPLATWVPSLATVVRAMRGTAWMSGRVARLRNSVRVTLATPRVSCGVTRRSRRGPKRRNSCPPTRPITLPPIFLSATSAQLLGGQSGQLGEHELRGQADEREEVFGGLLLVGGFRRRVALVLHFREGIGQLRGRRLELEFLRAFEFAEFALQFAGFTFDDRPRPSLAFERRTRRCEGDTAQGLRAPPAIGHRREAVEERLVLGLLLVLQLELVGEFVREPEFLLEFAGQF